MIDETHRFWSEQEPNLPLPPAGSIADAFDRLDPVGNSFLILERGEDYIQCGGAPEKLTVETREHDAAGTFKHIVFFNIGGAEEDAHIPMSAGGVHRKVKHCLKADQAITLFERFFEREPWPEDLGFDDITADFE